MTALTLLLAAAAVCAAAARSAAGDGIGIVLSLEGRAAALRGGAETPLEVRSKVYESDVVSTGAESKLQILLDDETSVTLGPGSTVDLIEFSEEAGGEKFEARLAEGNMRVITGETTERNPDGFKITTKHAAVAIRGTVLSLMTNDDLTRVDVESAKRQVLMNGREIREFNSVTVRADGAEEITPLPAGERAGDSRLSGAAFPTLPGLTPEGVNAALPAASQASDTPARPGPAPEFALASGKLSGVDEGSGEFSFAVNLGDGAITNGRITASGMREPYNPVETNIAYQANLSGGSGLAAPDGFTVSNFSSVIIDQTSYSDAGSFLSGPGVYLLDPATTSFEGAWEIWYDNGVPSIVDYGGFEGELRR
jgi:hypothetical protein